MLSAISLINIPLGTILGAYGLWVLLNKDTERLFDSAPRRDLDERLDARIVPPTASKHSFCISPGMPESGAPVPVPVTGSHTSTPQWQSFEVRMRRRRAERCLVRANLAFSAGDFAEARAAIDEAKEAAADFPGVARMELRLAGPAAELDPALHIEHARTAHVGADRAEKTRRRHVPVERASN